MEKKLNAWLDFFWNLFMTKLPINMKSIWIQKKKNLVETNQTLFIFVYFRHFKKSQVKCYSSSQDHNLKKDFQACFHKNNYFSSYVSEQSAFFIWVFFEGIDWKVTHNIWSQNINISKSMFLRTYTTRRCDVIDHMNERSFPKCLYFL